MSKTKLTPAQKEVIRKMREGGRIHFMNGLHSYFFWSGSLKIIRFDTIMVLRNLQLIEWDKDKYDSRKNIRLTELGKSIEL